MGKPLLQWSADRFIRFLRQSHQHHAHYAFFLGAGCSVSSGIPAAGDLVKHVWLPRLRELQGQVLEIQDDWIGRQFSGYDPDRPAASYGEVMATLLPSPGDRQREIENLCRGKSPSFGYAMLASLMAPTHGYFNVALTTNFDDLMADALYLFSRARPLVVPHEALAGFMRRAPSRPLVVKLHGDNQLAPLNTSEETGLLSREIKDAVHHLLRDCGLIFIGYGGNDEGIREMLESLPVDTLPHGVYWVSANDPRGTLRPWLDGRNSVWVEHRDFDELMLLVKETFGFPHADTWRLHEIATRYERTYKVISHRVQSLPQEAPSASALKTAVDRADQSPSGWWVVEIQAAQFKKTSPALVDEIYAQGLKDFPGSAPLMGNYANFLKGVRNEYDRAEELYLKAIDADPSSAVVLGDYAVFLRRVRRDNVGADGYYRRSFAADPQYALNLSNYATFFRMVPRSYDLAEEFYKRAIVADPYDPNVLGSYAPFLSHVRKDHDRAEEIYRQAVTIDPIHVPNLLMYASFLDDIRKDHVKAGEYYDRALAIEVEDDGLLGNLAVYLWEVRRNLDQAEEYFRRALAAEPENEIRATYLGNYATFLRAERGDYLGATALYQQAIEADPRNAHAIGQYAAHLRDLGGANDVVEQLYQQALTADPDHAGNLGNYAIFLWQQSREHERAQEYFHRALKLSPEDANTRGNFGGFLLASGDLNAGWMLVEPLLRRPDAGKPTALNAECWFYAFAHGPANQRSGSLNHLRHLIKDGARSRGWDFRQNIERAREDNHPGMDCLESLAAVISVGADPSILDKIVNPYGCGD